MGVPVLFLPNPFVIGALTIAGEETVVDIFDSVRANR